MINRLFSKKQGRGPQDKYQEQRHENHHEVGNPHDIPVDGNCFNLILNFFHNLFLFKISLHILDFDLYIVLCFFTTF